MIIVMAGFNIHQKNTIVYATFKTKDGAVRAFRRYLDTPDIQFLSIRKISHKKKKKKKKKLTHLDIMNSKINPPQ